MSKEEKQEDLPTNEDIARAKILGETARIEWKLLEKFFAAGNVLYVDDSLDLVDVAFYFSEDDAATLKPWVESEKIAAVSDQQAIKWVEEEAIVWSCVVKPWVLVQSIKSES